MYILGLTGSIAMGKTTVAKMFEEVDVPVFHSDQTVHKLFETRQHLIAAIGRAFPGSVKAGKIDREKLGAKTLANQTRLIHLEQMVHPYVFQEMNRFIKKHEKLGAKLIVLDIPLLFETGAEDICTGVVVVSTTPVKQKRRAFSRHGMTDARFFGALARQLPDALKRQKADFVIDTGKAIAETRDDVKKLVAKLTRKGH